MTETTIADALERIIMAGVALTTVAISRAEPGFELTFPQWRVLLVLGAESGGMRIGEVAQWIGVTLPATSRQLRRLERRGLVRISRDLVDRRAARADLTEAGRSVRAAILDHRRAHLATIAEPFESDARLRKRLDEIADALNAPGRPGSPGAGRGDQVHPRLIAGPRSRRPEHPSA